jgi:hypothetical protein
MPTDNENLCYDRPYMGQPFKLVQNEHRIEYGCITGFTVTSVTKDPDTGVVTETWTACVSSTVSNASFRFYHNTHRGDWIPLTAAEIAEQRGAAVLGDVVDKATFLAVVDRLDIAEAKLVEANLEFARLHERVNAFAHPKADDAKVPLGAPVPSDTFAKPNGRPSRVAATPP